MRRLLLLPLLLFITAGAQAQDCSAPRLLASMKMGSAEPDSHIRTVPVSINGATEQLILDTGGAITQLSGDLIDRLDLPTRRTGPEAAAVYDINGRVAHHYAKVKEFVFGSLRRDDAALMVWPEPKRPYAGELAQDMLQAHDVDVDFATNTLKMYAKDHCPGTPGWTPLIRVPMANKGWHLHIAATLDGRTYDAIFDTGSRNSILRLDTARRDFGISTDSPDMKLYSAINGDAFLDGYLHHFSKLSFGGITFENPELLIVPDVMNRNADRSRDIFNPTHRHNEGLALPQLTLGMDVLRHLHLFMAFSEQALYIAAADPQTPPAPTKP